MVSEDNTPIEQTDEEPPIPKKLTQGKQLQFNEKEIKNLENGGYCFFFKENNDIEYWLNYKNDARGHYTQWEQIQDSKNKKLNTWLSSTRALNVANTQRDNAICEKLTSKAKNIETKDIKQFIEELGLFLEEYPEFLTIDGLQDITQVENQEDSEKISDEEKKKAIEILKKPDLLRFIDEALYERSPEDSFIIGEIESKHTLNFNCVGARLGLSTINTLKGGSSIGKTNTGNVVTGLFRTKKVGSLSDTALKYADDLDQIDILYIQETLEEEFKNKETRLMSADDGGFIAETTVKNPKTGQFEVQQTVIPVKTLVTTTTAINLDPEFATRNFIIPVDDSEDQTIRILEENFSSTEKKLNELHGKVNFNYKYNLLKQAYSFLEPYVVLIPFEKELMEIFPTSNPRARRDSKKLMQLIKESALLFQYQRCKGELNGYNVLVASWVDLGHALLLSGPILEATLTGFDRRLMEALPIIYELIENDGYVTSKTLSTKLKKSTKYAWQILNFFEDNGYIYHDPDKKKEKNIKGKTLVYVKNDETKYKSLLLSVGNIDWLSMKTKEEKFIKTQILNSTHHVGDNIYLPEYDLDAPNKVTYTCVSIQSEEFRIYKEKNIKRDKTPKKKSENLKDEKRNENKADAPKDLEKPPSDNLVEKNTISYYESLSDEDLWNIAYHENDQEAQAILEARVLAVKQGKEGVG